MRVLDTFSPIYSIIVPVYNAQKYLDHCIESVLSQSSASEFELILVNDGSRDGSAAICDRYAEVNAHIHVIHQKNQGVSAARNAGIAIAKGQYVLFLDSDDIWDQKLLESVDCVIPQQPDMVNFGCCHFSDSGMKKAEVPAGVATGESGADYFKMLDKMGIMPLVSCWGAAFRRQFLMENRLVFPLGVTYGEDFYFFLHSLKQAKSIYTIPEALYGYRENEQSVTHNLNLKRAQDALTVSAEAYRSFPCNLLADYYCMRVWILAAMKREDAEKLTGLLEENRDILQHISGKKPRIARGFYRLFGWYYGARLLRLLVDARKAIMS